MRLRRIAARTLIATAMLAGVAADGRAQDGFLFRAPAAQLTVRSGGSMPLANQGIFDFLTSELTLERGDFAAASIGAELALLVSSRFDIGVSVARAESSAPSAFRDLIGDDGEPIRQQTRLRTLPLTLSARYRLVPRGRSVADLAWTPTSFSPYIGAGAGFIGYRLQQQGEFVDYRDNAIYNDFLESKGSGQTVHALAGLDYWFAPRIGVNAEARYTRGSAPLDGNFRDHDDIDLSGLQAGLGLTFRW
jgi:outer membrane protein W